MSDHTLRNGLAAAALLVFGGVSVAAVNVAVDQATPTAHAITTKHTAKPVVLPKCAGIDDMLPCYQGGAAPFIVYHEARWVNADQPVITTNHVLILGGRAYYVCKDDASPGPCWIPKGILGHHHATVVNGDDEELLSDLAPMPVAQLQG